MAVDWLAEVRQVMSAVMLVPPESVRHETVPNDVPSWDSISHLTLVLMMEEQFGVRFSDTEIEHMTSVGKICTILADRRSD